MDSPIFCNDDIQFILASGSPRRKQLLEQIGLSFLVIPSQKEEHVTETLPSKVVEQLSYQKCMDIASQVASKKVCISQKEAVIIGADTIVANGGKILGKPATRKDARHMLTELSGQAHYVYTGVTLCRVLNSEITKKQTFHVKTKVVMKPSNNDFLNFYLDTEEPYDKAGSYGIQGLGTLLVDHIEGDYNNVVGLPVSKLYDELTAFIQ